MKRENEALRNKLAEATLTQNGLEQDVVDLRKVGQTSGIKRQLILAIFAADFGGDYAVGKT